MDRKEKDGFWTCLSISKDDIKAVVDKEFHEQIDELSDDEMEEFCDDVNDACDVDLDIILKTIFEDNYKKDVGGV